MPPLSELDLSEQNSELKDTFDNFRVFIKETYLGCATDNIANEGIRGYGVG